MSQGLKQAVSHTNCKVPAPLPGIAVKQGARPWSPSPCSGSNGMDRSCEATIYPVLDKPHTTEAFQDRRKIEALLRPA
jgi:hypothetical protein